MSARTRLCSTTDSAMAYEAMSVKVRFLSGVRMARLGMAGQDMAGQGKGYTQSSTSSAGERSPDVREAGGSTPSWSTGPLITHPHHGVIGIGRPGVRTTGKRAGDLTTQTSPPAFASGSGAYPPKVSWPVRLRPGALLRLITGRTSSAGKKPALRGSRTSAAVHTAVAQRIRQPRPKR
jgi:hypothetical protein